VKRQTKRAPGAPRQHRTVDATQGRIPTGERPSPGSAPGLDMPLGQEHPTTAARRSESRPGCSCDASASADGQANAWLCHRGRRPGNRITFEGSSRSGSSASVTGSNINSSCSSSNRRRTAKAISGRLHATCCTCASRCQIRRGGVAVRPSHGPTRRSASSVRRRRLTGDS
jgi:hypothetical protein